MGKPLSEESKRKIREAFARKREAGAGSAARPTEAIAQDNASELTRMGALVQQGKAKWAYYATGSHHYEML
jgi:hypothetical protein